MHRRRAAAALFAMALLLPLHAGGQITADPAAAGAHRATVLRAPNGVPLVNIQTPSAAGVSRNVFDRFDVGREGAILNNSPGNTPTRLGGWVQGNPWLATGGARVILGEVNSSQPSALRGAIEVAGGRAQVVLANPAGFLVDGAGFINTSRATLSTGRPLIGAGGTLDGWQVRGGSIVVQGDGLDARETDYTALLARSVQLAGGVWAQELKVVTGSQDLAADGAPSGAIHGPGAAPAMAIDVAQLGGMYAGRVFLVATEAGAGVRNDGVIGASAGQVHIDAAGWLRNAGAITASGDIAVRSGGELANTGRVQAAGALAVDTRGALLANTGPDALLLSGQALQLHTGALRNAGRVRAEGALAVQAAGLLDNRGGVLVGEGAVRLQAQALDNTAGLLQAGAALAIQVQGALHNADTRPPDRPAAYGPPAPPHLGIASGGTLSLRAATLDTQRGRIVAEGDAQLVATSVDASAGVIAAGGSLHVAAQSLAHTDGLLVARQDLAVETARFTDDGRLQAGRDLSLVVQGDLHLTAENLATERHLTLAAGGHFSNAGQLGAPGDLRVSAAGALDNTGSMVAGQGLDLRAATGLTNMGALVGASVELAAGERVANRGPGALVGGTDPAGTLTVLAPVIENSDDDTATDTAPSTTLIGLGGVVLAGGRDGQGGWLQAQDIVNRSALIESGGDMALHAAQVTNTRRQLVMSGSFDQSPPPDVLEAAGIRLSGQVGEVNTPNPEQIGGVYIEPPHGGRMNSDYWYTSYEGSALQNRLLATSPRAQMVAGADLDATGVGVLRNQWSDIAAARHLRLGAAEVDQDSWRGAPQPLVQVNYSGLYHYRTYKGVWWTEAFADDIRLYAQPVRYDSTLTAGARLDGRGGSLANGSLGAGPLPTGGTQAPVRAADTLVAGAIGAPAANLGGSLVLPAGSLFRAPADGARYLLETDPRFTQHRQWLSSDYLLQGLGIDPASLDKRAGDGLVEQRLVREQLLALTGRPLLAAAPDEDAQYRALLDSALTQAHALDLRPGVALGAQQVAQLTSDLVWLVRERVALPDGSAVEALVPRLYLSAGSARLRPDGALVAAHTIDLQDQLGLRNGGTLSATAAIHLQSLQDLDMRLGSVEAGGPIELSAARDIQLTGALLRAGSLRMDAGRDILIAGATQTLESQALGTTRSATTLGREARVEVDGDATMQAGRDLVQHGAALRIGGSLDVAAGRDWDIGALATGEAKHGAAGGSTSTHRVQQWQGSTLSVGGDTRARVAGDLRLAGSEVRVDGHARIDVSGGIAISATRDTATLDSRYAVRGATGSMQRQDETLRSASLATGGDLQLRAGGDLAVTGSRVSAGGALDAAAAGDIRITAATQTDRFHHLDVGTRRIGLASSAPGTSPLARSATGSGRITSQERSEQLTHLGSSLEGATVRLAAGRDLQVAASTVLADRDATLAAGRDLTVEALSDHASRSSLREERRSGLSISGASVTAGSRSQSTDLQSFTERTVASTVGSVGGSVTVIAGGTLRQSGSDVLAPGGDVTLVARSVVVDEATERSTQRVEQRSRQSGVSLGVSSPILATGQQLASLAQAAGQTGSGRMQALAAASAALTVANNAGAIGDAAQALAQGDIAQAASVSLSVGSSRSQSVQTSERIEVRGASVAAGGTVLIEAAGGGSASGLLLRGASVSAGRAAVLVAEGDVRIEAAQGRAWQDEQSSGSAASVGLSVGAQTGLTVAASRTNGKADGQDLQWTNSRVQAGEVVAIRSGGDTTLRGGVVQAARVQAQVAGDLHIESLQDASTFTSRSQSTGASVTFSPAGVPVAGSVSASRSVIASDYLSVVEQSALRAGDAGFSVEVQGATRLIGAQVTSTQAAVDAGRNRFDSAGGVSTVDLQNQARYEASATGVTVGVGTNQAGSYVPQGASVGWGSDGASVQSVSRAAISGIAGAAEARTGDAEAGLGAIFDRTRVQQEVNAQLVITSAFTAEAPRAVASHADRQASALHQLASQEPDPARRAELQAEAGKWQEGGLYRVALHTATGAMAGGLAGAAGAAASAQAAPSLAALQDQVAQSLRDAGAGEGVARLAGQLISGATATALGAVASGGSAAGAGMALGVDANNRQLHARERSLIEQLARDKAQAQCQGSSECEKLAYLHWADALERVAESLVDEQEKQGHTAYRHALERASLDLGSEAARGALARYMGDLATARAMLEPYIGQPIVVNGQAATAHGAPQTYFNATPAQWFDPTVNTFLGQAPGSVAPLMHLRDEQRLAWFSARNGSAQAVYPVEEVVLGGVVGGRVGELAGRAVRMAEEAARGGEGGFSLLGGNRAVIDGRKLTEYALNPAHPVGGSKARVFESALGFTKGNADDLMVQLRQGVMNSPAMAGKVDQFGARFTVDIPVTGPAGRGVVRSGWIYKTGSDTPELTTIFVK